MAEPQAPASDLGSRLGDVRASVRPNLEVSRHIFSGKPMYVVRDPVTAQSHRFSADDYQLFISIDQSRTLKESLQQLITQKRVNTEQSDDFYRFVVHLHQMGLLTLPLSDGTTLHNRHKQRVDAQKKGRLLKLLFLKVPLAKPDKWLDHTQHWFAPLFTLTAMWIWLGCLALCGVVLLMHWQEFVNPLGTMLTLSNLPILWVLLVSLKSFHELGHAYACKRFGGTVPEIGAMIMMGTPCAYVDASSSWSFPNRWHRMVVALAGMYFESMLAMVALIVWLVTDTGQIHSAAQYAIVLSTVVTIGFNANPLMRYDGYFILSDLVNMPNLHRDAKAAAASFIKWVLFGLPIKVSASKTWIHVVMTLFGLACMVYQVTVSLGIAALLILAVPTVGPLIAAFVSGLPVVRLLQKWYLFITKSKELEPVRTRAIAVSCSLTAVIAIGIFVIPIPGTVQSLGIVHRFEEQSIRATVSGFLVSAPIPAQHRIGENEVLYRLENPELQVQRSDLEAQIQQLSIQVQSQLSDDLRIAEQTHLQLESTKKQLEHLRSKLKQLDMTANFDGEFEYPNERPRQGKFVHQGEQLGSVCRGPWVVRAKLTAEQWSSIQSQKEKPVSIQLVGSMDHVLTGRIIKEASAGSKKIEEVALTHTGGGNIAVSGDMTASENFFDVIVEIDEASLKSIDQKLKIGMSSNLSFRSSPEPVAAALFRKGLRLINQVRQAGN